MKIILKEWLLILENKCYGIIKKPSKNEIYFMK
jgi:hypothetical protein